MRTLALLLLSSTAAAAPPTYQDEGDIVVVHTLRAPPEAVFDHLTDLEAVVKDAPERCMRKWELGPQTTGEGATFRVVYLIEAFRRKLDGRISMAERPRRLAWDHAGNKGFVTRFGLEAVEGGTRVEMRTFLNPPGWPLRRYYANTVQPGWQDCYRRFLEQVDETLGEGPPEAADPAQDRSRPTEPAQADGTMGMGDSPTPDPLREGRADPAPPGD
jgi:uncharacterized protein YndB with AHSA1/START domain